MDFQKEVLKEFKKPYIAIDLMLYSIYVVIGFIILKFPQIEVLEPMDYVVPLFYMFSFFGLLAYFVNRRKNDYEFLALGLINIVAASYVIVNSFYPSSSFIIGSTILLYSISNVLNKGYHTRLLMKNNSILFLPKFATTILLALLGVLVVFSLYDNTDVQTMILGYYFMAFGLLNLIEPFLTIIITNPKLSKQIKTPEEKEVREKKTVRPIRTKKPVKKITKKVIKKKEKIEKKVTKKKTKKD